MVRHGLYAVSVYALFEMTIESLVQRVTELSPVRYRQLRSSTAGALRAAGFALLPTLDWPHLDIVLPDVETETLDRLEACFGPPFRNPGA